MKGRLRLSDAERATLGEIAHRLGRKALGEVATVGRPDTILAWYRKLLARKFDGSKARRGPGRPRVDRAVEQLIVRMAEANRDWGYDRIVGALANLGYEVCDQTVGNILRRHSLPSAPERRRTTTWPAFIRTHLALLAGTDFFTAEVLTLRGINGRVFCLHRLDSQDGQRLQKGWAADRAEMVKNTIGHEGGVFPPQSRKISLIFLYESYRATWRGS